ncbi:MAG: alpha-xenorhabdolysin family binary toxin subunit B [Candidatus Pseudomonas phytovorans]|uniref:Alpha-xenorhabdolysin family binary toxin subunit B n=1 Tax=Candidatus Pseudomonas phytovorans TaxID=3121377 RepID=A0AAJ5WKJ2_9PSED|nr:alpha-xenorhabdolysin family binary toxin subunit B [Pseudomonas sp.]WEK32093.1 MAG: alpha-xenorhabdolysin family binary toxin subunit B [Pseudomonas sp.]
MEVANIQSVTPDFVQMQKVQEHMFQLMESWEMNVLPAAREQLDELRSLMLAVERAFKESLIGGITLLDERDFVTGNEGAVAHQRLASVLERLSQHHAHLVRKNLRLELFSLSALVDSLAALAERTAGLQGQAVAFDQRLEQLQQQRADIVQAIEVFEKPSVASALKGLIPSDDEIDQIMGLITDPKFDAGLLKVVTQKLASHADALEGAKTFSDLGKARARLDAKIEEALGDQQQVQRTLKAAQDEVEAVKALSAVESLKNDWLRELRLTELEWQAQATKLNAAMDLEAATVALKDLCDYLKVVQLMYDRS